MLAEAVAGKTITAEQLYSFMQVTESVKTRIRIVAVAGPHLTDPRNKQEIIALFRYSEDKKKVEAVLKLREQVLASARFASPPSSPRSPASSRVLGGGGRGRGRGRHRRHSTHSGSRSPTSSTSASKPAEEQAKSAALTALNLSEPDLDHSGAGRGSAGVANGGTSNTPSNRSTNAAAGSKSPTAARSAKMASPEDGQSANEQLQRKDADAAPAGDAPQPTPDVSAEAAGKKPTDQLRVGPTADEEEWEVLDTSNLKPEDTEVSNEPPPAPQEPEAGKQQEPQPGGTSGPEPEPEPEPEAKPESEPEAKPESELEPAAATQAETKPERAPAPEPEAEEEPPTMTSTTVEPPSAIAANGDIAIDMNVVNEQEQEQGEDDTAEALGNKGDKASNGNAHNRRQDTETMLQEKMRRQRAALAEKTGCSIEATRRFNFALTMFDRHCSEESDEMGVSELRPFCHELGYFLHEEEVEQALKELDTDGNGLVSFDEFLHWWTHCDKFESFSLDEQTLAMRERAAMFFDRFDADGNGSIDAEEFKEMHSHLTEIGMTRRGYQKCLKELDENGDGEISFNEFIMWVQGHTVRRGLLHYGHSSSSSSGRGNSTDSPRDLIRQGKPWSSRRAGKQSRSATSPLSSVDDLPPGSPSMTRRGSSHMSVAHRTYDTMQDCLSIDAAQVTSQSDAFRECFRRNTDDQTMTDDLVALDQDAEIDVDVIVRILKARFEAGNMYTSIDSVLIAVNPYEAIMCGDMSIYAPPIAVHYLENPQPELAPHVFSVGAAAYGQLRQTRRNQCILITGESGSGKTETCKLLLQYIALVSTWEQCKQLQAGNVGTTTELNGIEEESEEKSDSRSSSSSSSSNSKKKEEEEEEPASPDVYRIEGVKKKLLESVPVLEAFGNAKTALNHNSSRFGKYVQVFFDFKGDVVGGCTSTFLLEKSRIVSQADGERSFHILHYLLHGASSTERAALGLLEEDEYAYMMYRDRTVSIAPTSPNVRSGASPASPSSPASPTSPGMPDAAGRTMAWSLICTSLLALGFSEADIASIGAVLSAILLLGNVEFDEEGRRNPEARMDVANPATAATCAQLLQLSVESLTRALTQRTLTTRGGALRFGRTSEYTLFLDRQDAEKSRNSLATELYNRTFQWLVAVINAKMGAPTEDRQEQQGHPHPDAAPLHTTLSLSDLYGFEVFESNGFQQFCINYCNERLHRCFVELTMEAQQREYRDEGLEWTATPYDDNGAICTLIEGRGGLFSILDDTARFRNASSKTLLDGFDKQLATHACFIPSRQLTRRDAAHAGETFGVKHFAGNVVYRVNNFLEKNQEGVFQDILQAMRTSSHPLLSQVFRGNASSGGGGGGGGGGEPKRSGTGATTTSSTSAASAKGGDGDDEPGLVERTSEMFSNFFGSKSADKGMANSTDDARGDAAAAMAAATAAELMGTAESSSDTTGAERASAGGGGVARASEWELERASFAVGTATGSAAASAALVATGAGGAATGSGSGASASASAAAAARKAQTQQSVAQHLKRDINRLVDTIKACEGVHYIRCLKSNESRRASAFDASCVTRQARYLGLVQNVHVHRAGFFYRQPYSAFIKRFHQICAETRHFKVEEMETGGGEEGRNGVVAAKDASRLLLTTGTLLPWVAAVRDEPLALTEGEDFALGKTKVFVRRAETIHLLQQCVDQLLPQLATRIQARARGFVQRRRHTRDLAALVTVQRVVHAFVMRRRNDRDRHAAVQLQALARGFVARRRYQRDVFRVVRINAHVRAFMQRLRYHRIQRGLVTTQARARAFVATRDYQRDVARIVRVQAIVRGWLTRRYIAQFRAQYHGKAPREYAVRIQAVYRSYACRQHAASRTSLSSQDLARLHNARGSLVALEDDRIQRMATRIQLGARSRAARKRYTEVRSGVLVVQSCARILLARLALAQRLQTEIQTQREALRVGQQITKHVQGQCAAGPKVGQYLFRLVRNDSRLTWNGSVFGRGQKGIEFAEVEWIHRGPLSVSLANVNTGDSRHSIIGVDSNCCLSLRVPGRTLDLEFRTRTARDRASRLFVQLVLEHSGNVPRTNWALLPSQQRRP